MRDSRNDLEAFTANAEFCEGLARKAGNERDLQTWRDLAGSWRIRIMNIERGVVAP
jgi:hypothetical protein